MEKFSTDFLNVYRQFTAMDCDRCAFIREYLAARGVDSSVIPIDERRHIHVSFSSTAYSPLFRIKTIIAHYDRTPGSPGANDNSSSVISIMNLAVRLSKMRGVHNVRIFFTDGEEFSKSTIRQETSDEEAIHNVPERQKEPNSGGRQQDDGETLFSTQAASVRGIGSYALANHLKKLGLKNDDVYVFDCTGRGTVPILGETDLPEGTPQSLTTQFSDLENRTKALIRSVSPQFLTLPISYSDNAGFLACKIPALVITMLPEDEAVTYMKNLLKTKELKNFVLRRHIGAAQDLKTKSFSAGDEDSVLLKEFEIRSKLPDTWKLFHTEYDSIESLTPESFTVMEKILDALALSKTMA
ncbi:M28 family peptidase [Treponema parvum]|uniref:M28 family peptidase n=1 Tax=Treponema parvum TaxID=138851 RepID=A0A975EYQ2_9SPIR|nr:M28 family peptidase [Treponema parvum]QTQ11125.1 M28 family peptidase [Treponema parvum]